MQDFKRYYDLHIEPKMREFDSKAKKHFFAYKYRKKDLYAIKQYITTSIWHFINNDITNKDNFIN